MGIIQFFRPVLDASSVNPKEFFWLALAAIPAVEVFADGIETLIVAWQLPEYSHGPLIPLLSLLLFLRHLKAVPI